MDAPVISRDMIAAKARQDFLRGAGRDDHNFNWHSTAAIDVWQSEWDRCWAEKRAQLLGLSELGKVSPP